MRSVQSFAGDERSTVLGMGRVCLDQYLLRVARVPRLGSVKLHAIDFGTYMGGSVPRILSCIANAGHDTSFIGKCGGDPADFAKVASSLTELGVRPRLVVGSSTCRSIVTFASRWKVESIVSIQEVAPELLTTGQVSEAIFDTVRPDWVVIDLRHVHPAARLVSYAKRRGVLTFADVGSRPFSMLSAAQARLLQRVDIVCTSEESLRSSGSHATPAWSSGLWIVTRDDGSCVCIAPNYEILIRRTGKLRPGNTLGAGDVFRGWFLACLLRSSATDAMSEENITEAVKVGLAAAAWKIQHRGMVAKVPQQSEVSRIRRRLNFAVRRLSKRNPVRLALNRS
jgi:sugar/nucleoside kinase (ribokinase family)